MRYVATRSEWEIRIVVDGAPVTVRADDAEAFPTPGIFRAQVGAHEVGMRDLLRALEGEALPLDSEPARMLLALPRVTDPSAPLGPDHRQRLAECVAAYARRLGERAGRPVSHPDPARWSDAALALPLALPDPYADERATDPSVPPPPYPPVA